MLKQLKIFDQSLVSSIKDQLKRNMAFNVGKLKNLNLNLTKYQIEVLEYLYSSRQWRSYYEINIFLFASNNKRKMAKCSCDVLERSMLIDSQVVENGMIEYRINDFGILYVENEERAIEMISELDVNKEIQRQVDDILNTIRMELK